MLETLRIVSIRNDTKPNGNLLVGALTLNWKLRTGGSFRIDNRFVVLCRADENEVNEK